MKMTLRSLARAGAMLWSSALGCTLFYADRSTIAWNVRSDPHLYLRLCGRTVAGLREVEVEPRRLSRTAEISAIPLEWDDAVNVASSATNSSPGSSPNSSSAEPCRGVVEFDSRSIATPNTRGTETGHLLWNVRLRDRPPLAGPAPVRWQDSWEGLTLRGDLAEGISLVQSGRLANEYALDLPARVPLTFIAQAVGEPDREITGLDPRIELWRGGELVAASVRANGSTVPLYTWVEHAGTYVLRLTSERDNGSGPYGLELRNTRAADLFQHDALPLLLDETVTAQLDWMRSSYKRPLFVDYQIVLPAQVQLSLILKAVPLPANASSGAKQFSPHLDLVRDGRVLHRADDAAEGISQIDVALDEAGTYALRVSGRAPDSFGAFTLVARAKN